MSRRFSSFLGFRRAALFLILLLSLFPGGKAAGWGAEGHYIVLRAALDSLSAEARRPYAGISRELRRWMMEPDKHHVIPAQSARHWIDIERTDPGYLALLDAAVSRAFPGGEYADEEARGLAAALDREFFSRRPLPWGDAEIGVLFAALPERFSDYRREHGRFVFLVGTVVYQPARYTSALVRALDSGDRYAVARYAGYLAHYAADACVPFHVTANYRGQHSGNLIFSDRERGTVHARFEDGFIEARAKELRARIKPLLAGPEPLAPGEISRRVAQSASSAYRQIRPLLEADRAACALADPRRRWNRYLREVAPAFEEIALRQLAESADLLASLLLSAHLAGISDDPRGSGNMEER